MDITCIKGIGEKRAELYKKIGVETAEQYEILKGMKVRLVQGYYFDRPMPKNIFEEKYV